MAKNLNIVLTVEKTVTGFSAFAEKHPIFTTGKTFPDLIMNAYEASELFFEDEVGTYKISFHLNFL
jgi:predicted RNase H-like HicB family nuclease